METKVIQLERGTSCTVHGKEYPVTAVVEHPKYGNVPVIDIPVMSDEKWNALVSKAKAQHPEYYKRAVMT